MFGWGHGVAWYDAPRVDALGGLIAHAATRHTAATTAQFFAGLITLGLLYVGSCA